MCAAYHFADTSASKNQFTEKHTPPETELTISLARAANPASVNCSTSRCSRRLRSTSLHRRRHELASGASALSVSIARVGTEMEQQSLTRYPALVFRYEARDCCNATAHGRSRHTSTGAANAISRNAIQLPGTVEVLVRALLPYGANATGSFARGWETPRPDHVVNPAAGLVSGKGGVSGHFMTFIPTLLVVDDQRTLRDALAAFLESEGYIVADATNGRDALVYLGSGQPVHIIIVDLDMPVMDGWEFLRRQKQDCIWRTIPTFVITGLTDTEQKRGELGDARVFQKPLNFEELLEAVRAELDGAESDTPSVAPSRPRE
jgi:CheY-like chemotaxis protein